ncbi:MAG: HD domain-containing protein [Nitrospirota bacterium]|nr:HD domain-containing protein [Nitrospirota bacterium]MDH4360850.1 HD domain-containing protein [Nitrospirota bacterium]
MTRFPSLLAVVLQPILKTTHTVLTRTQVAALLKFYDRPHPTQPHRTIRGYDKAHALRTARMCVAVAVALGHRVPRLRQFEAACLLHDMGRAGLDPVLFGKIWSWAREQGIPTRPREWRALHPQTVYGRETQAFITHYQEALQLRGLPLTPQVKDHIEMRLGFARRLGKQLRPIKSVIQTLDIPWASWMGKIMLYYYYPEKLEGAPFWMHQLGEILVACENLEAYSNQRRGKDYYARSGESFQAAFTFLRQLISRQIVSQQVFDHICRLTREGCFTTILRQARGGKLSPAEHRFLQTVPV